ncbi:MAG: choice-of-anchor V domain-containing protein, partial [Chloroflexota bacterium]
LRDARVQLIPGAVDKALSFVQHNQIGSRAATPGANTWTLEWTAPPTPAGPVQFNVAANATNNDDSPLGDFIYVKAVKSSPSK